MQRWPDSVWYDPKTNQFFQLREELEDGRLFCGGFCHYYEDAKTTILTQILEPAYFSDAKLVERIADLEEAYHKSGIGWRVRGERILPA